jgi:hypothetical protein
VYPVSGQRVEVRGQRRGQRLPLPRGHLADAPRDVSVQVDPFEKAKFETSFSLVRFKG